MASENELLSAVKESLKVDGHLVKFQAEMRSKIMSMLNSKTTKDAPTMPEEVMLINELIREYLNWMGYMYTSSVLSTEANMGDQPPPRATLSKWVGINTEQPNEGVEQPNPELQLPLMYTLLTSVKKC